MCDSLKKEAVRDSLFFCLSDDPGPHRIVQQLQL